MLNNNTVPKDKFVKIRVKKLNGEVFEIPELLNVNDTTVLELKEIISSICEIPSNEFRLVWKNKVLSNNESLIDNYGLDNESTLILAHSPQNRSCISDNNTGMERVNNSSNLDLNMPSYSGDDFLSSALSSPFFQNIFNDPEIFKVMLDSNPQIKSLREQNPELNHIFNDPQFLQMSLDALKNPELMKEMMRNSDRAMSNIESIPGGFSALKRMYHTVQEPMWDAALYNQNNNVSDSNSNNYIIDKTSGPNSEALPNPWASNSSSSSSSSSPLNLFNFGLGNEFSDLLNFGRTENSEIHNIRSLPGLGNSGFLNNRSSVSNMNSNHTNNNINDINSRNNSGNAQSNNLTSRTSNNDNILNLFGDINLGNIYNDMRNSNNSQLNNLTNFMDFNYYNSNSAMKAVIDAMRNININDSSNNNVNANFNAISNTNNEAIQYPGINSTFDTLFNLFNQNTSSLYPLNQELSSNANKNQVDNNNKNNVSINVNNNDDKTKFNNDINIKSNNTHNDNSNNNNDNNNNNSNDNNNNNNNNNNNSNNGNNNNNNNNISNSAKKEDYNYQLEVLSNMGFTDTEACIRALSESDGSINRAIDRLLNPK
ncbi:UBA TS-N domain-containing [Cryptosporidium bovis]|uniref:UBA TS-N domain-containing n=1 Tax=Cryptosporidium bovis TaxID=310047 RepID=UPI00351A337C|nr:UBA TS-N domain-containing [Cryptosporidium bovis]